jgi:uncharacterized protein
LHLSEKEVALITSGDICRLSTIHYDNGWPHCVPVGYVYANDRFYVPSDRNSIKVRNLLKKSSATVTIDEEATENGIMFQCDAKLLDLSEAEQVLKNMIAEKEWKNDPNDSVVIELRVLRKSSWF